mgnify:CR=1 FL=1
MSSTTLRRKDKYARYMWLIDTIRHDRCTLQEIDRRWQQEETLNPDGVPLSRRTFQQHKEAINAMDFGVEIICTSNRYYSVRLDEHNPLGAWMWQTLSLRLMLAESRELNERIITDEIPSADRWLHPILSALRENRRLRITYRPFGKEAFSLLLSPYFVQMSDRRWIAGGRNIPDGLCAGSDSSVRAYGEDLRLSRDLLRRGVPAAARHRAIRSHSRDKSRSEGIRVDGRPPTHVATPSEPAGDENRRGMGGIHLHAATDKPLLRRIACLRSLCQGAVAPVGAATDERDRR